MKLDTFSTQMLEKGLDSAWLRYRVASNNLANYAKFWQNVSLHSMADSGRKILIKPLLLMMNVQKQELMGIM